MRAFSWLAALGLPVLAARKFEPLTYSQIRDRLSRLAADFPDFAQLYTAQERYGLASPGTCDGEPCKQFILRLCGYSEDAQPPELPEAFVSGALHGDERVGPVASLEAAELLVYGAACAKAGAEAESCERLAEYDLSDAELAWLYRLLSTRAIYVMPMTNALGYAQDRRTENSLDPNRDFPYDYKGEGCMHTITARSVNELFREHIFQVALTFHAGMEMIGYEWGSTNHDKQTSAHPEMDISPDDVAQHELARGESQYAGSFQSPEGKLILPYRSGKMAQTVYSVNGGMEDWAYAGSWDNALTPEGQSPPQQPCKAWDDYPSSRSTEYEDATLRCFLFLIETSDKHPIADSLGETGQLLSPQGPAWNGHVARNVRLFFMHMDVLRPIVQVLPLEKDPAGDSQVSVDATKAPLVVANEVGRPIVLQAAAAEDQHITLEWTIWGSFEVNEMEVFAMPWPMSSEDSTKPSCTDVQLAMESVNASLVAKITNAVAQWESVGGAFGHHQRASIALDTWDTLFSDTSDPRPVLLGIRAVVDASWGDVPEKASPTNTAAQSHIVNARTNPAWDKALSNGKHRVKGQQWFYGSPMLVVEDPSSTYVVLNPCSPSYDEGVFPIFADASITDKSQAFREKDFYVSGLDTTTTAPTLNFSVPDFGIFEPAIWSDHVDASNSSGQSNSTLPANATLPADSPAPSGTAGASNQSEAVDGQGGLAGSESDGSAGEDSSREADEEVTERTDTAHIYGPSSAVDAGGRGHVWPAYFFPIVICVMLVAYVLYRKHVMRGTYMSIPAALGAMSRGGQPQPGYPSLQGYDLVDAPRSPLGSGRYAGDRYGGSTYRGSSSNF